MRGDHSTAIAAAVGISVSQVSHLVCVLRIPTTTEFRRHRLLKLHRQGFTAAEVAERLGLTGRAVNTLRVDLSLPPFFTFRDPPMNSKSIHQRANTAGYHFQAAGIVAAPDENWILIDQASGDVTAFATLGAVAARLREEVPDAATAAPCGQPDGRHMDKP